ncbi:MAG: tRNA-guanine transglycosylase, partial [Phycisphaerales bacterium]
RLAKAITRDKKRHASFDHGKRLLEANERTVRWLERCKKAHARASEQALFGIVQGGADLAQRRWSAERICAIDLPGYAIGGVAVGETFADIARVVAHTAPLLPTAKPRYLMGVGYERDLLAAVLSGVDMFDCVLPTRNARNASVFTATGQLRLRNAHFAEDQRPLEEGCDCGACRPSGGGVFSRAYLRHLFMVGEMLGPMLVTMHNLRHFQRFMEGIRGAIRQSASGALGAWQDLVRRFPVAGEGLIGPAFASGCSERSPDAT